MNSTQPTSLPLAEKPYNGRYASVAQIVAHVRRKRSTTRTSTVLRALKSFGVKTQRVPGINGYRMKEGEVNKMLALHFPDCGPLPVPAQ